MARGTEAFKARLAKVPEKVRKAVAAAHEKSAEEWVRTSRRMAPDDPRTTGKDLKASIRNHPTSTGGQVVRAGGETTTRGGYDYARGQEFGTVNHPPSPFFWPAYRFLKRTFAGRRKRAIAKALKET